MNNKWLDQYALRYAVGTVLGAAITAYLFTILPSEIREKVPKFEDWGRVFALTACGLAFCYIASAPLLVVHVIRSIPEESKKSKTAKSIPYLVVAASAILLTWIQSLVLKFELQDLMKSTPSMLLSLFSLAIVIQLIKVRALYKGTSIVYKFYADLSARRVHDKGKIPSGGSEGDLVESYRGIREHGNAYSIILFEVFLAFLLASAITLHNRQVAVGLPLAVNIPTICMAIVALWVLPAAYMLNIAGNLEIEFSKQKIPPEMKKP